MSESAGFTRQLMRRRVPQIMGAYVAGLWLAVEIGGWVTEQLDLPSVFSLYLFVVLVALLPSVLLLAWRHGQPGPDGWGRVEKLALPGNVLIAIGLVAFVVQVRPPLHEPEPEPARTQAAVIERTLVDEDGQEQVFQVVREGYGLSVLTLFWPRAGEDAAEPSWESYAAPWLLSVDLGQDPLISGGVAFDRTVIERLASAGFEDGLGEPLALGLNLAADNGADFLIRGEFEQTPVGYSLRAELHAVADGGLLESVEVEEPTLIAAADRVGDRLGERLVGDLDRGDAKFRPVSLEERTTSQPDAVAPFIEGVKALTFDSDYESAVASLQTAVDIDPTFAQGWAWLQQVHRLAGDMAAAKAATEQALARDYKLDTELRFILRANQYAIGGDVGRAVRVLRMWTEVEPYSLRAWTTLTRNLLLIGEIDEAREANVKAKRIDPDRAALDRARANIEELAGNFALASEILAGYLEAQPQDDAAWVSLGDIRQRTGSIEGARQAYERAGFVASNDFASRERLLRLEARTGDPARAAHGYRRALQPPLQLSEEATLVRECALALGNLGRIQELLELIDEREAVLEQSLPPMVRRLTIEGMRAGALTSLGRFDQALELIDRAEKQVAEPFDALFEQARIPIFEQTGDLAAAQRALERLRELVENFEMPGQDALLKSTAARVLAMQDDHANALARLDEAQEMLRGTTMSLASELTDPMTIQRAEYQLEHGQADEALLVLDDFLINYPNSGQAQLLRARALEALGRVDEAQAQVADLMALLASADGDYLILRESMELAERWGMTFDHSGEKEA